MLPWFCVTNHSNYAHWLPVHLCDMRSLDQMVPHVALEFKKGLFTVNKSLKRFLSIAIDQAHEQNNAMVKGEGGAVGLTENPNALRQWMLSGPEMARLVNEFEAGMVPDTGTKENSKHHEEHRSFQVTFFKDVKSLAAAVEDLGNYGGPQVSRQMFDVNTAKLKKLRRHLFFSCYLSFRQALLFCNGLKQDLASMAKKNCKPATMFVSTTANV